MKIFFFISLFSFLPAEALPQIISDAPENEEQIRAAIKRIHYDCKFNASEAEACLSKYFNGSCNISEFRKKAIFKQCKISKKCLKTSKDLNVSFDFFFGLNRRLPYAALKARLLAESSAFLIEIKNRCIKKTGKPEPSYCPPPGLSYQSLKECVRQKVSQSVENINCGDSRLKSKPLDVITDPSKLGIESCFTGLLGSKQCTLQFLPFRLNIWAKRHAARQIMKKAQACKEDS